MVIPNFVIIILSICYTYCIFIELRSVMNSICPSILNICALCMSEQLRLQTVCCLKLLLMIYVRHNRDIRK